MMTVSILCGICGLGMYDYGRASMDRGYLRLGVAYMVLAFVLAVLALFED